MVSEPVTPNDTSSLTQASKKLIKNLEVALFSIKDLIAKIDERKDQVDLRYGVSFLDTKIALLLNYCKRLVFYIMARIKNYDVEEHGVIRQLLHTLLLIQNSRPIEKKLRYTINKTTRTTRMNKKDPLSHKPRPNDLIIDEGPERPNFDDSGEVELYRPPMLNPVFFEDDASKAKRERRKEFLEKKLKQSELLDVLRGTGDRPEEESMGMQKNRQTKEDIERNEWELKYYKRAPTNKREKRMLEKKRTAVEDLTNLSGLDRDIKTLNALDALNQGDEPQKRKRPPGKRRSQKKKKKKRRK